MPEFDPTPWRKETDRLGNLAIKYAIGAVVSASIGAIWVFGVAVAGSEFHAHNWVITAMEFGGGVTFGVLTGLFWRESNRTFDRQKEKFAEWKQAIADFYRVELARLKGPI